jgi:hypothetical protein
MASKNNDHRFSSALRTVELGSVGPVLRSPIVSRLRYLATVLTFIPSPRLSAAVIACDRCIAALTACVPSHGLLRKTLPVSGAWRSRDVPVPDCFLPFLRNDRTIKPWKKIPSASCSRFETGF